jgi:hypothetical protein
MMVSIKHTLKSRHLAHSKVNHVSYKSYSTDFESYTNAM